MRMLDLFCGLGGASVAFREAGWEVIGVDIDPKFKPEIVADLTDWHWEGGPVNLLWASPPCQEFSLARCRSKPRILNPSMDLVLAAQRIIREVNPEWWVIENVRGAVRFIGPGYQHVGAFYLWSNLPDLGSFTWPIGWKGSRHRGKHMRGTPAFRARIPRELSECLLYVITHQQRFDIG